VVLVRSRTLGASVPDVWRVLSDPYAMPRWWPLVRRVEGVGDAGWTMLLGKPGGRGVRADQRLEASEPQRMRRWSLLVPGSPFERLLTTSVIEARLAPAGQGSELRLELRQSPRGWARLGGLMLRRAARRQLDEALAGMARAVEPGETPSGHGARGLGA
jgi:uncharacterized protein YndB with AHSA1/START domain